MTTLEVIVAAFVGCTLGVIAGSYLFQIIQGYKQ